MQVVIAIGKGATYKHDHTLSSIFFKNKKGSHKSSAVYKSCQYIWHVLRCTTAMMAYFNTLVTGTHSYLFYIYTQEVVSIISGTGAATLRKTNFGPTGHHHPRRSPLPYVCTVPSTSATF
jgi:hypothetical protein